MRSQRSFQPFPHLVFIEFPAFEVMFHQRFIIHRNGFYEFAVPLFRLPAQGFRNRFLFRFPTTRGVFIYGHAQQIHDGVEARTAVDGKLYGYYLVSKMLAGFHERSVEIGILQIHFVDGEDHRCLEPFRVVPDKICTYFNTCCRVDQHDPGIGYPKCGDDFAIEVIKSRRVDDIDLVPLPVGVHEFGEERVATFPLEGVVVAYRISFTNGSRTIYDARFKKHAFCQGGLARSGMPEQGDVPDMGCIKGGHGGLF